MAVRTVSPGSAGFTLTELIIVLVISGIILAISAPRFFTKQAFDARGYAEETLAAVRYAQKFAISSGCDVQVSVTSAGYSLAQRASLAGPACTSVSAFTVPVRDPSLQDKTGSGTHAFADNIPSGVTVTGTLSFYYDKIGRPTNTVTAAALSSTQSVNIAGPSRTWTITVEPETGYAHL